jgi:uncharacterized integral membrane protein (TIGR00698 family)
MKTFALCVLPLIAVLCLTPWVSAAGALVMGIILALAVGNPYLAQTRKWTPWLLQASVVGLGAAMNLEVVARVGLHGFAYTAIGITLTCLAGWALGRFLRVERVTSILITAGTAICGGSAIAAVGAAVRANSEGMSVALGTVFLLNAAALMIFPPLGHWMGFSPEQFGLWCALAIHDTSSVVGAALQFGPRSLEIATTVKLTRALWIIPLTLVASKLEVRRGLENGLTAKPKRPWFILGFVLVAALVTWVPELRGAGLWVAGTARQMLVLVLFLIGCSLTPATLKAVGFKPFAQGFLLWIFVAVGTAAALVGGLIRE